MEMSIREKTTPHLLPLCLVLAPELSLFLTQHAQLSHSIETLSSHSRVSSQRSQSFIGSGSKSGRPLLSVTQLWGYMMALDQTQRRTFRTSLLCSIGNMQFSSLFWGGGRLLSRSSLVWGHNFCCSGCAGLTEAHWLLDKILDAKTTRNPTSDLLHLHPQEGTSNQTRGP